MRLKKIKNYSLQTGVRGTQHLAAEYVVNHKKQNSA